MICPPEQYIGRAHIKKNDDKGNNSTSPFSSIIMSPLSHDSNLSPPLMLPHDVSSISTADDIILVCKKWDSSPTIHVTDSSSSSSSSTSTPPTMTPPSPPQQRGAYHTRRRSLTSPIFSLLRRNSRSPSFGHSSSYAGPTPLGKDGNPLKSCLSTTKPRKVDTKVSFSHVSIREYSRVVGDNPSVCCGPPLSLGWKYNKQGKTDIDTFEAIKTEASLLNGRQCQRRTSEEREKLLTDIGGANHSQIMRGSMQASYDNKLRWQSFDRLGGENHYKSIGPRERVLIMKESARRKFDRACKGTSTSRELQDLWDKAQEISLNKAQEIPLTNLKRHTTV